jgi:hypothetical protein
VKAKNVVAVQCTVFGLCLFDCGPVGQLSDRVNVPSSNVQIKNMTVGMAATGLSRFKKLNGIAFRTPFVLSRLLRPKVTVNDNA